jgi:hypothetical protein
MDAPNHRRSTTLRRIAWFALIWTVSVATLGLVAWVLRSLLNQVSR